MYYRRDCFWDSLSESTQLRGSIRHLLLRLHGFQCNPGIGGGVEQKNDALDMVYILRGYTTGSVYILGGCTPTKSKTNKTNPNQCLHSGAGLHYEGPHSGVGLHSDGPQSGVGLHSGGLGSGLSKSPNSK